RLPEQRSRARFVLAKSRFSTASAAVSLTLVVLGDSSSQPCHGFRRFGIGREKGFDRDLRQGHVYGRPEDRGRAYERKWSPFACQCKRHYALVISDRIHSRGKRMRRHGIGLQFVEQGF